MQWISRLQIRVVLPPLNQTIDHVVKVNTSEQISDMSNNGPNNLVNNSFLYTPMTSTPSMAYQPKYSPGYPTHALPNSHK